ncbi:MAG: YbjQ family protein [Planctomycetota bacterium]|jgi:uncharacterized protein YbjQ (UPF0145 family)
MNSESTALAVNLLINIGIPLFIIILAMITGTILEKKHYESIKQREHDFLALPCIPSNDKNPGRDIAEAYMVCGSTVVSLDYFKRILAGLRNIIGGRVRSYESLLDRGRREAILRMKEQCRNADIILNFRMETSSISKTKKGGKKSIGCIEVLAYGTAVKYTESSD